MKKGTSNISIRPKDLELSLFTLWSIFVLIDQHYKAVVKYKDILYKERELKNDDEIYLDTIYEALVYQILLKGCSFLDECDQVFGIKTETEYNKDVRKAKSIAKPARKFINSWKGLREFRNQAIAHNHRDEKGNNIYYIRKSFHTPEGLAELALFIYCIEKMAKVAGTVLLKEWRGAITKPFLNGFKYDYSNFKRFDRKEIIDIINSVDKCVEENFKKQFPAVINTTSDYGDFLKVAP